MKARPICGRCARAGLDCTWAVVRSAPASLTMIRLFPLARRALSAPADSNPDETPSLATRASRLYELTHAATPLSQGTTNGGICIAPVPTREPTQQTWANRPQQQSQSHRETPAATSIPTPKSPKRDSTTPTRDTGHLYVGPHTKGHYISSAHFALISQEVSYIGIMCGHAANARKRGE